MAKAKFLDNWLAGTQPDPNVSNLWVFNDQSNTRQSILPAVCEAVKDHLIGLDVIEKMGGYKKAAAIIKNRLPSGKKIRSGDLGEILAGEYVEQKTDYHIPIRRLRYKDDRQMSMRGDDVIAVREGKHKVTQVLKVEAKSRASLASATVAEASEALLKNSSRPNPNTFQLRYQGRHKEAKLIEQLQQREVKEADIAHLLFTFSGNHPAAVLTPHATTPKKKIRRLLVGFVVSDHQAFIKKVFQSIK